jgi:hypothetical protein
VLSQLRMAVLRWAGSPSHTQGLFDLGELGIPTAWARGRSAPAA